MIFFARVFPKFYWNGGFKGGVPPSKGKVWRQPGRQVRVEGATAPSRIFSIVVRYLIDFPQNVSQFIIFFQPSHHLTFQFEMLLPEYSEARTNTGWDCYRILTLVLRKSDGLLYLTLNFGLASLNYQKLCIIARIFRFFWSKMITCYYLKLHFAILCVANLSIMVTECGNGRAWITTLVISYQNKFIHIQFAIWQYRHHE